MVLVGAKDKRCPRRCCGLQTQVRQTLSMAGVFGGEAIMLTRREAAGRDRLLMAGRVMWRATGPGTPGLEEALRESREANEAS